MNKLAVATGCVALPGNWPTQANKTCFFIVYRPNCFARNIFKFQLTYIFVNI